MVNTDDDKRLRDAEKFVENCKEPEKLKDISVNLRRRGHESLADKAAGKAFEIDAEEYLPEPKYPNDEREHILRAMWVKSIGVQRKRAVTFVVWQAKDYGYVESVKRQAVNGKSGGGSFMLLAERGGLQYSSEYQLCTVLADEIDEEVLEAARSKLREHGVDI